MMAAQLLQLSSECRLQSLPAAAPLVSTEDQQIQTAHGYSSGYSRTRSGYLLGRSAYSTRRPRHIAFFINEVTILVVPLNRIRNQHLGFAFAGFRLAAYVPAAINKVQILLVVPFQMKFFDLFCHTLLECK